MSNDTGTALAGRSVLVTRAEGQADELIELLSIAGANVVHIPAIRFEAPPSWQSLDHVIDSPSSWHWIIFTSTNGVEFFVSRLKERQPVPDLVGAKIAAVGPATAGKLRAHGIVVDVVPPRFHVTEILPLLPDDQNGVRTAVIRALDGRDELIDALRGKGGEVHLAVAYATRMLDTVPAELRDVLLDGKIDALTFTSPSSAEGLLRHFSCDELTTLDQRSRFVSIGPTTTDALRHFGLASVTVASEASMQGLVGAVIQALGRN